MRKEARKLHQMGIRRGPKQSKQLHVPNLYPYKKKMIQQIESQKLTDKRKKMLERLTLKSKASLTNIQVVKEDPQEREAKYLEQMTEKSSIFFFNNLRKNSKEQKAFHERIEGSGVELRHHHRSPGRKGPTRLQMQRNRS
jgi:hypothetical protein